MKKTAAIVLTILLLAQTFVFAETQAPDEDSAPAETGTELRLPIVMYHHMSPKSRLWCDYVISVDEFESDLKYLREEGYESVTMAELLAWSEGEGELPEKPFMITFDDGYESTAAYAAPLLEQYGFTGVMAVIGSSADLFTEQEDHCLDYSYLSWDKLSGLSWGDVLEVQCHTQDMHKLRGRKGCGKKRGEDMDCYREALTSDLSEFRERCEEYGVRLTNTIAFPYGRYSQDTVAIVKEMGFEAAFTCLEQVNVLTGEPDELFELGRYNRAHGKSSERFFSKWESKQ